VGIGFYVDFNMSLVDFHEPQFDHFKNAPRGEIGRAIEKNIGIPILLAAKRQVGVDSGQLMNSIQLIHRRVGAYQELVIESENKIALLHHEGTRPHSITAGPKMLRFSSRGRTVYTHHVNHPGTRPNRYLTDNLYLAYV